MLNQQSINILNWLREQLEIVRTGEVPRKAEDLTFNLEGEEVVFKVREITEDHANGFSAGKDLALGLINDILYGDVPFCFEKGKHFHEIIGE